MGYTRVIFFHSFVRRISPAADIEPQRHKRTKGLDMITEVVNNLLG
jgi:hypothetical protein